MYLLKQEVVISLKLSPAFRRKNINILARAA